MFGNGSTSINTCELSWQQFDKHQVHFDYILPPTIPNQTKDFEDLLIAKLYCPCYENMLLNKNNESVTGKSLQINVI